ncbi:hypothetical protein F5X96DRAFT_341609 [Biscogniauxia mediterranea]|nr:hypothetical protein F5X96DRAFT_341609 [Biscogniauxia mediterranea]
MASPTYHYYGNSQSDPHGTHADGYHYTSTSQEDTSLRAYDDGNAAMSGASPTFTPSPGESVVYEIYQGTGAAQAPAQTQTQTHNNDSRTNKGPVYESLPVAPGDTLVTDNSWNNHNDGARKPPGRNRSWGRQFGLWMWEILACLLSLCALAAVIGVLVYEDGKPLDQWAWVIGPTAVVAFISTVTKSSMLLAVSEIIGQLKWQNFDGRTNALADLQVFDNAGRGPWGATKFLAKKNIKSLLGSLASILIIVGLLVDPFMQLVFNFPALSREDPEGVALFNGTEVYDPNAYTLDAHLTSTTASAVDAIMQSAIIRAVSGSSTSPSASCSTGNCTWSGITTMGVCASCTNITGRIIIDCPGPTVANHGTYQCDYLMPSGKNISGFLFSAGATGDYFPTLWNSTATALDPGMRSNSSGTPARLAHAEAVQLSSAYDAETESPTSILRRPTAWQCDFTLCAKTYADIVMTNGVASAPAAPAEDEFVNTGNTTNQTVALGGGTYGLSFLQGLRTNSSSSSSSSNDSSSSIKDYRINEADYSNLASYLAQLFSSGWGASGFGASNGIAGATAPNLGWELAGAADLDATARAIAAGMTEVMRNSRNATGRAGVALRTRTYIDVRWGWVALPATLTALSLLLTLFMVASTRRADLPVWKNSSLAVLAHRVEAEAEGEGGSGSGSAWPPAQGEKGGPADAGTLKREARGLPVTLLKSSGELAFVRG